MSLQNICVIGFDLDGTLYYQTPEIQGRIRSRIYEKIAGEFAISFETAEELFEENYNGDYRWSHSGSRTIEELGKRYDKRDVDGSAIIQESVEEADIVDLIEPNPQLVGMFERLIRKFGLDLITSSTYKSTEDKLGRLGVKKDVFTYFLAEGRFGGKGNGEVYQYWIRQGRINPEQMLYVGDNKKQDIDSPNLLGIRTCFVGGENEKADYSVKDILELEALLK